MSKRRAIGRTASPDGQMAGEALLEAIENQLRDNNPAEVSRTLSRLMSTGLSREEAMRLIGVVLATEIFEIMRHSRKFDERRYSENLKALPTLPAEASDEI